MNFRMLGTALLLAMAVQACGGGGGAGAPDTQVVSPAVWTGILRPDGGTFSSPAGVEVSADPGAIRAEVMFTISETTLPAPLPAGATQVGAAFDVSPSNPDVFEKAVKVSLPYEDSAYENQMQVLHWNSTSQLWERAALWSQDAVSNRIQFTTGSFSPFYAEFTYLPPTHGHRIAFEDILVGTQQDFTNAPFPRVRITSHKNGETVNANGVVLSGDAVANGAPMPRIILAIVNGILVHSSGGTAVSGLSHFAFGIPLAFGDNSIELFAGSGPILGQSTWQPHLGMKKITLVGLKPTSPFVAIVSVDQDTPFHAVGRIGLYVYDPEGKSVTDYVTPYKPSYYFHQDPTLKSGFYHIRIHNDTFPQPTKVRGVVTIVVNGKRHQRAFLLVDSRENNWHPWATGPDWFAVGWVDPSDGSVVFD